MGEDITVREIGIYLLNRVEVTLKDDSRAEGILQNIAAETITVEGREIMLSDVADIRLAGELTDYDVMRDTGMIGNFTFAPEACRDAAESLISTSRSSSISGMTSQDTKEVCLFPAALNGDIRTRRCTPFSDFR